MAMTIALAAMILRPKPKKPLDKRVTLSPEDMTDMRCANRVSQRAFIVAGGARRYIQQMDNTQARTEILARAWAESYLSLIGSGTHTNIPNLVAQQIIEAWGDGALADSRAELAALYDDDRKGYPRHKAHPVHEWALK